MIVPAAELKSALKKLSPVRTETFQVSDDCVSAQDPDCWVVHSSPLTGLGDFNIGGKKFTQVVNRMGGQIDVLRDGNKLILKSARARVELEVWDAKEVLSPSAPRKSFVFKSAPFKKALIIAAASASPHKSANFGDVVRIETLGLGLEEDKPSGYRVIGTDSKVLTAVSVSEELPAEFHTLLNLEAAAIVQLMDGDTFTVGETGTAVYVADGKTSVYASRPIKEYPNFRAALALKPHTRFQFLTEDWKSALHTVEPLVDESVDGGIIQLIFKDNCVTIATIGIGSTAQDAANYEQIDPDPVFDPKELTLRFNAKYLSGFLAKAGKTATLGLTDNPVRMESDGVVQITMPVEDK